MSGAGAQRPRQVWRAALPLGVAALIALSPAPAGLAPNAWHYFAIFSAVILALITEPLPSAAVGLIGVTLIAALGLPFSAAQKIDPAFRLPAEAIKWALAGFANSVVWLIFGAFVFAMGYEKTGLGRRIALALVRWLGGRTLGLGYAIMLADFVLAPFTPSNSARSAGTIFPVVRGIPPLYASLPGESARKIGAYLMWTAFAATCVTSSMFVTAVAPNLLALELVKKATGIEVTWVQWFTSFLPIGALLLLALPWLVYKIYPPEIRTSAEVPQWAAEELARLGAISRRELTMAALVVVALGLWIFGGHVFDAALVALVAVSLMIVCRVVSWDDILRHSAAWNTLVWFATMINLADGLNKTRFITWFGQHAAALLAGHSPLLVLVALVAFFYLVHYIFAGLTAHTTAVLPVMLAAGAAVPGMPVRTLALLLVFSLGIMGVLTPYATGPAPIYYGCGYITRRDFWRLGLIFGLIFLAALLLIGVPTLGLAA
jgi:L-tartrate/succinate antiporter